MYKTHISRLGYSWISTTSDDFSFPQHSVLAGYDADGAEIYVGRSYHANHFLPAKVIPSKKIAYISYAGDEIPKDHFEVHFSFCHFISFVLIDVFIENNFRFFVARHSNGLPVQMVMCQTELFVPETKATANQYMLDAHISVTVSYQAKCIVHTIVCIFHLMASNIAFVNTKFSRKR